tara:strand:+ start:418 stop:570 length:153 start_codon:yes stop_codon:yes gene_type:complete
MKTVITVSDEIIVALGSTKRSKEEEEEEENIFHTDTHTSNMKKKHQNKSS